MRNLVYDVRRYYRTVAPFMDAELAGRGDGAFWCAIGREHRGGSILELGCGSGRVTAMLADSGARLTGIDVSPDLIGMAQRRLAPWPVWLLLADMRRLAFRGRFDAIVAPDDPFSHLTSERDRADALRGVAVHLAPGGRFVLDALWFPPAEERQGASPLGLTREHDLLVTGRTVHVTEHWRCNARTHRCATDYDYEPRTGKPAHASFQSRYWTARELDEGLLAAGLRPTRRWGGYDGQPWDAESSPRLLVEAALA